MSLINQMLKELDARRSEVTGTDSYGQQIRAVPSRKRFHPAWIVVGILGVVSSGLMAWVLLRPPGIDPALSTKLPLKFDASMNKDSIPVSAPTVQERPIAAEPVIAPVVDAPLAVPADAPPPVPLTFPSTNSISTYPSINQPVSGNTATLHRENDVELSKSKSGNASAIKEADDTPRKMPPKSKSRDQAVTKAASDVARPVPATVPAVSMPAPAATNNISANVVKQIKELTSQQRAENEFRKAIGSLQQGKSTEAIAGLEQALALDPKHAGARQTLIGVLLEAKRTDDALKLAREGLAADDAQPGLAMIAARLQLARGDLRPAIETLERSASHASDRADYHAFLAALLQRDGQHKKAVDQYLLALQKTPQNGVWWMGLGISLQADQKTVDAQEAFKRAKESNGLSPELLVFVDSRLSQLQR